MSEFCATCAPKYRMRNDAKGLCKKGEVTRFLCEECGLIWVDHLGLPVSLTTTTDQPDS